MNKDTEIDKADQWAASLIEKAKKSQEQELFKKFGVDPAVIKHIAETQDIPEHFPKECSDRRYYDRSEDIISGSYMKGFYLRDAWIKRGMYGYVCWDWVDPFVKWIGKRSVLEVMSGNGWLAKALRERGVQVKATDDHSWRKKHAWSAMVSPVIHRDAIVSAVTYGTRYDILIMSWPYMDEIAYKTIQAYHAVNPQGLIVYIGESEGGCTADEEFFNHYQEIEDDPGFNAAAKEYHAWWGIHDRLYLGKYRP